MKKIIFLIATLFSLLQVQANNADLFKLDEKKIDSKFKELNIIEEQVEATNYDLGLKRYSAIQNTLNPDFVVSSLFQEPTNNTVLPPFLWGCLTGPVGMVVVYVMTDGDQKKLMKSLWGCLAGGCVWIPILLSLSNGI